MLKTDQPTGSKRERWFTNSYRAVSHCYWLVHMTLEETEWKIYWFIAEESECFSHRVVRSEGHAIQTGGEAFITLRIVQCVCVSLKRQLSFLVMQGYHHVCRCCYFTRHFALSWRAALQLSRWPEWTGRLLNGHLPSASGTSDPLLLLLSPAPAPAAAVASPYI